jgi:hypothetical protein
MRGGERVPCRLSISKWGFRNRDKRANCTVCTVALLPEPWNASIVGFTGPVFERFGASLGVMYVGVWLVVIVSEGLEGLQALLSVWIPLFE